MNLNLSKNNELTHCLIIPQSMIDQINIGSLTISIEEA
jgi:hypothetical protein